MKISDVRYSPFLSPKTRLPEVGPKGLVGFVSCILEDSFFLGNIAVFQRLDQTGYRLVFPVRMSKENKEFKIFFPLTRVVYDKLLAIIVQQIQARDKNI